MKLPELETGRTYKYDEVRDYIVKPGPDEPDDFVKAAQHWWPEDLARRHSLLHENQPMLVEYRLMPTCKLEPLLRKLHAKFSKRAGDEARVQDILKRIEGGEVAYPVFFPGEDDPVRRIREGQHRAVAFWRLGAVLIPVFLMK
jgi:hypothetical protein